ncbi:MAG: hypothetical protein PHQ50_04360 [Eubacteriales bacterium]|nr:hypothetical protein [Eubacteriales bacterium]
METLALIRNKLYATYQFHGILGKGKEPNLVFRTAIAEIFLWLRERFREFEEVPKQIILPENISKVTDEMLRSFRVDDGYIIETLYIPEEQIWSFRLTEPDMGTTNRAPVPGRLFMTNYGIRVIEGMVEFGSQTVCSEPETTTEDAEVFRPKVIRTLKDKLGLFSLTELEYRVGDLNDESVLKKYQALISDEKRVMPVVVLERTSKCNIQKPSPCVVMGLNGPAKLDPFLKMTDSTSFIPDKQFVFEKNEEFDFQAIANKWSRSLCSFAYVFYKANGKADAGRIDCPGSTEIQLDIADINDEESANGFSLKLFDSIMKYPKRNSRFLFGNVLFLTGALARKQERELTESQDSADLTNINGELNNKIRRLEYEKKQEEQLKRDFAEHYQEEKNKKLDCEFQLKVNDNQWLEKYTELEKENKELKRQLGKHAELIKDYEVRDQYPTTLPNYVKWVEQYFDNDIILLPRAKDEIRKAKNCDIEMMCDAIAVLAYDYKPRKLGRSTEEQYIEGCKSRGNTAFEITLTGEASIMRYAEKYKVPYEGSQSKADRRTLDMHLKAGVDTKFLIRIYFFWDKDIEKVVIGSMPGHLPIAT